MNKIGTPFSSSQTTALLLGSGELGKYITIELQKLGIFVVACDNYLNAPAMQVAQQYSVFDMTDCEMLKGVIDYYQPDFIIPEVEAIATDVLVEYENKGYTVVPSAKAAATTMNRSNIRNFVNNLGIKTSNFLFASSLEELRIAVEKIGYPCVIKPVMSSSGKGQSICRLEEDIELCWIKAGNEGRVKTNEIIIEEYINFDYEITLLTVQTKEGVHFCKPIGHQQQDGDYIMSWQPHNMTDAALLKAQEIAHTVVSSLGGFGIFGVEFFVKGDEVYFSELSPRPHDTGLVTLVSQNYSQFALHVRALLELSIPSIKQKGCSASVPLIVKGKSDKVYYENIDQVLQDEDTEIHLFGKPEVNGKRRMGVILTKDDNIPAACNKVASQLSKIKINL